MQRQRVVAFDFDGTLTTCDTLPAIIRYIAGTRACIAGFLRYAPQLILMKLHLYPNYRAKQLVFSHFFRGMPIGIFNSFCEAFAKDNKNILRPEMTEVMNTAVEGGCRVAIVSASIENWVTPFFHDGLTERDDDDRYEETDPEDGSDGNVSGDTGTGAGAKSVRYPIVIGTKVEVVDGRLTGRFLTPNCYGPEKVRRLREVFPDLSDCHLTVYGDSRGDREMLAIADKAYYRD